MAKIDFNKDEPRCGYDSFITIDGINKELGIYEKLVFAIEGVSIVHQVWDWEHQKDTMIFD